MFSRSQSHHYDVIRREATVHVLFNEGPSVKIGILLVINVMFSCVAHFGELKTGGNNLDLQLTATPEKSISTSDELVLVKEKDFVLREVGRGNMDKN